MMGKRKSVVVHTPRNVDLPPHVVMIRGSEDEALYMSSENGEQKPTVSYPRKRCFCLCAWLFGLILLCIGVFIIIHYLMVDTGETLDNKDSSTIIREDERFSIWFKKFDISKVCNDSLESSLTLRQKFALSDYVLVGSIDLQQDMKRSISNANYRDTVNPTNQYTIHVDKMSSPLKGSLLEVSRYDDQNQQIVIDISYDNECQSPYAIAASARQQHILFFVTDSKLYNNENKNMNNVIPLFHPLPSTSKLVHIIRRLAEEDSARQAGRKSQSSLDRLKLDLPREVTHDLSSSLPGISAVKLNGIQSGEVCNSDVDCLYGARCVGHESSSNKLCSCALIPCAQEETLSENKIISRPVCGSDGVTYRNPCGLKLAACGKGKNITTAKLEPCERDYDDHIGESALCGKGGCPFGGVCMKDPPSVGGQYQCRCKDCDRVIGQSEVVCGDDGVDYASDCHLQSTSCRLEKSILKARNGPCKKDLKCDGKVCRNGSHCKNGNCICPANCNSDKYEPVCGSDGHTYFNECLMTQQTCPENRRRGKVERFGNRGGSRKSQRNKLKRKKIVEVIRQGPCAHPKVDCSSEGRVHLNETLSYNQYGRNFICQGKCPIGVSGQNCHKCMNTYWGYTSFGCTECRCSKLGSLENICDDVSGKCTCKPGFKGDKCEICPDGLTLDIDEDGYSINKCQSENIHGVYTTKYKQPVACGKDVLCDFGATCSSSKKYDSSGNLLYTCLCEIDCSQDNLRKASENLLVCASDGNTYRSGCHLRQHSCRIQKEMTIISKGQCLDKTEAEANDLVGILSDASSDNTAIDNEVELYGLLEDPCIDDRDCFLDYSQCEFRPELSSKRCQCKLGFIPTSNNLSCEQEIESENSLVVDTSKTEGVSFCQNSDGAPTCLGGGTCEEHDGTFTCYCPPGLAGDRCQHDLSQHDQIAVASFLGGGEIRSKGSPSYVVIKSPADIISRLEVEMTFRTFGENGLLLYGGAGEKDEIGNTDFIVISIVDRFIEFSFDLGGGAVVLRSMKPVTLGEWHHLVAKRYHQDGLLELDGTEDRVRGSTVGSLRTLNIASEMWIGGFDLKAKPKSIRGRRNEDTEMKAISNGFIGCIKNFKIGRQAVLIHSKHDPKILSSNMLVDCVDNPCSAMPCENEGSCQAAISNSYTSISKHLLSNGAISQGFVCKCKPSFTGRRCQRRRNECHPNPCQNRGKCILGTSATANAGTASGGFRCECKSGFSGRLCGNGKSDEGKRYRKSTLVDDKQRISFGLRMNRSLDEMEKIEIKMKVKLFSSTTNGKKTFANHTNEGQLVLSMYEKGRKILLSLYLSSEKDDTNILENKNVVLANWSSPTDKDKNIFSAMDNEWHHVDITFHQHKTFTLTVNNRSQREKDTSKTTDVDMDSLVNNTSHDPEANEVDENTHKEDLTHISTMLKGITFVDSPLIFSDSSRGKLCLKQYHIVWWRHGRKRRTNSYDICR